VIAQEAGGLIRGSPSTLDDENWFTEEFLWGRKYIVVRCISLFTNSVIIHRRTVVFTFYIYIDLFLTRQYEPSLDYPPAKNLTCRFASTGGNRSRCPTPDHTRVLRHSGGLVPEVALEGYGSKCELIVARLLRASHNQ